MLRPTRFGDRFRPARSKGQSFLRDNSVIERIVATLRAQPEDVFLEIGAGSGELTLHVARAGARHLLAVEPEPFLARKLRQAIEVERIQTVEVIEADFLSLDLAVLLSARGFARVRVVGNLPYSAASPILSRLLTVRDRLADLTLMFQQEVAERLVALPGTKAYGYLSVIVQQATRPRILFRIPPGAFSPRPKVYSALLRMVPRGESDMPVSDPDIFRALVKALLAHRRKNISNNIKRLKSPLLKEAFVRRGLEQLDIDPCRRAESLTVEEFTALSYFCTSPP